MTYPNDYIELDFLAVETAKSGDAITIRYAVSGIEYIHVVNGGFTDMGKTIVEHIDKYYTSQNYIDNVVLTHSDGDHALGLKYVLENKTVTTLWMNRPWMYADELLSRFKNYSNVDNLRKVLREAYSYVADLEDIALERGIEIKEAFQGAKIGAFTAMAPSKVRYLDLVVNSDRTPAPAAEMTLEAVIQKTLKSLETALKAAVSFVSAAWGEENLPEKPTSAENDMSIIQYANFNGIKFLLTGDAGRDALREFIAYAPMAGLYLPGIDRFQVPHHGSRRNVSSDILDTILGDKMDAAVDEGSYRFTAIISSALADPHHPKKAVERALHHRGGKVLATEGDSIRTGWNAPARDGWNAIGSRPYPTEQEE